LTKNPDYTHQARFQAKEWRKLVLSHDFINDQELGATKLLRIQSQR
jgi:hypothetical protein